MHGKGVKTYSKTCNVACVGFRDAGKVVSDNELEYEITAQLN